MKKLAAWIALARWEAGTVLSGRLRRLSHEACHALCRGGRRLRAGGGGGSTASRRASSAPAGRHGWLRLHFSRRHPPSAHPSSGAHRRQTIATSLGRFHRQLVPLLGPRWERRVERRGNATCPAAAPACAIAARSSL